MRATCPCAGLALYRELAGRGWVTKVPAGRKIRSFAGRGCWGHLDETIAVSGAAYQRDGSGRER